MNLGYKTSVEYYIDLIKNSNLKGKERLFKSNNLFTTMSLATCYIEYMENEEYNNLVKEGYLIPLMTFNCRGQTSSFKVEKLLRNGFNYDNIICIGNNNDVLFNKAVLMKENNVNSIEINKFLKDKMRNKIAVVVTYDSIQDYVEKNKISLEELRKYYIPTTPLERELGISNEMKKCKERLEIEYSSISDTPFFDFETFIAMLSRDNSLFQEKLTITLQEQGKRKSKVKGLKRGTHVSNLARLGGVFHTY